MLKDSGELKIVSKKIPQIPLTFGLIWNNYTLNSLQGSKLGVAKKLPQRFAPTFMIVVIKELERCH